MPIRIVVYAEGSAEGTGTKTMLPQATFPLKEENLGSAHFLIEKCIYSQLQHENVEIRFDSPLRHEGTVPFGGMLKKISVLRRLLVWFDALTQPDLAIVLVDSDGDTQLKTNLLNGLQGIAIPKVIGVPHKEFESWLIADWETAARVLGTHVKQPNSPEQMNPRKAKELLRTWTTSDRLKRDSKEARIEIAKQCDISKIRTQCGWFDRFCSDLGSALRSNKP